MFLMHRSAESSGVVNLPYYGGADGQILQVIQKPDGSIESSIIRKDETKTLIDNSFQRNLNNIQEAAAKLVTIQESAKKRGSFSTEDNEFYANNLYQLGIAAQNLAKLQQQGDIEDFRDLFSPPKAIKKSEHITNKLDASKLPPPTSPLSPPQSPTPIQVQHDVVDTSEYDLDSDSIQVNAPSKDASVAEAKPVGLAIAGQGGVAASKPVATAISGDHGLAIARPVATAIAGVSPDYIASYGIATPSKYRNTLEKLNSNQLTKAISQSKVEKPTAEKSNIDLSQRFHYEAPIEKIPAIQVDNDYIVGSEKPSPSIDYISSVEGKSKKVVDSIAGVSNGLVNGVVNKNIPNYRFGYSNLPTNQGGINFRNYAYVPTNLYGQNSKLYANQYPEILYFI